MLSERSPAAGFAAPPGLSDGGPAWKIAREQGRKTTYDAEYLAITSLRAGALVTVNPARAGNAKDLVPLAQLATLTDDRD